jgi:GR25 family glycosyltransferase involved in LPS biosynthesis
MKRVDKNRIWLFFLFIILALAITITYYVTMSSSKEAMSSMSRMNVDVVYYINLDHREDRKKQFLGEMKKIHYPSSRIHRISGIYKPEQGDVGCTLSHIETLTQFIHSPYHTCIIFEDDFEFVDPSTVTAKINKFLRANIQYDVCLLAGGVYKTDVYSLYPGIAKAIKVTTTSGYIVTKAYAATLLANYKEGCALLEKSYQDKTANKYDQPYAIDQYWDKLQAKDHWFIFQPALGKQRESYSDIMKGVVKPTS